MRILAAILAFAALVSAQTAAGPAFEAASIKVQTNAPSGVGLPESPDRFVRTNASLRDLIRDAYGIQSYELVGAPDWSVGFSAERYNVIAKAASVPKPDEMRLMVQRLLAERFALRVHREMREMPTYLLRTARDDGRLGKQMNRSSLDCDAIKAERAKQGGAPAPFVGSDGRPICTTAMRAVPFGGTLTLRLQATGMSSGELAAWLPGYAARPVIDRTGLTGLFDLELAFSPGAATTSSTGPDDTVSVFTALQEQLGLKLDSATSAVSVVVVDHAEHPTGD